MAPPPVYEQVMEHVLKAQEFAVRLEGILREGSPEARLLAGQILACFTRVIPAVDAAAKGSEAHGEVTSGGKRKAGGGDGRVARRRRTQQASGVTKTTRDLDDGQAWRKYGQKEIHNSNHPKAYFRCTHKYDQQCLAQRQVQRCDDDPDTFRVTYIGVHTCRDPAAIAVAPHVIHQTDGAADVLHAGSRLISFAPAPAPAPAATTSTTTTSTAAANAFSKDAEAVCSSVLESQLKQEMSGEQEEVLSSLTTPGRSAVCGGGPVAAAAAAGGPDHGDVTSILHPTYGDADDDMGGLLDFLLEDIDVLY